MSTPSAFSSFAHAVRGTGKPRSTKPLFNKALRVTIGWLLVGFAALAPAMGQDAKVAPAAMAEAKSSTISFKYLINPWVVTINTSVLDIPGYLAPKGAVFTSTPPLPTGLTLNALGVISGTPKVLAPKTSYTISFTSSKVNGSAVLTLTVIDRPPAFSYPRHNSFTAPAGSFASYGPPTSTGGAVVTWSAPSLPAGLSIDAGTGVISGTPTTPGTGTYPVTGTNSGGHATVNLTLTITPGTQLPLFSYPGPNNLVAILGTAIQPFSPTATQGGPSIAYALASGSNPLPAGLSLNGSGTITGTPTVAVLNGSFQITGTNSAGSTTVTVTYTINFAAPVISYPNNNPQVCTTGTAITNIIPAILPVGDRVQTWSISPTLPAGLSIDPTGTIRGTPAAPSPLTQYTVTASNGTLPDGTATVTLTVNDPVLSGLSYSPVTGTINVALSDPPTLATGGNAPDNVWSIVSPPSLPAWLHFSTSTGTFSGTPPAPMASTTFNVMVSNASGSTTGTATITVSTPALAFYYPSSPSNNTFVFTTGVAIPTLSPTITAGNFPPVTWSAPSLPAGLVMDTSGKITGTPTVPGTGSYTVTGSNAAGPVSVPLTITVNDPPPANLSYSGVTGAVGTAFADPPALGTGANATDNVWSIDDPPPASRPSWLQFSTANGTLAGTPTAPLAPTTFTVRVTNSGGFTTGTASITVPTPALAFYYPSSPSNNTFVFTTGGAIPTLSPTITAGNFPPVTWSAPSLPAGLVMDASGNITGTPTVPGTGSYTVTGGNAAGPVSVPLTITVKSPAPTSLTYPTINALYGTALGNVYPTLLTGGNATDNVWTIQPLSPTTMVPPVPSWLSIDPSTGVISGTPSWTPNAPFTPNPDTFTVAVTNSGGSTSTILNVSVTVPPVQASYPPSVLTKGTVIPDPGVLPIITGGNFPPLTWSATGLPAGLSIDSSTGAITGTPTAASAAAQYPVTVTNFGAPHATTIQVTITVHDTAPTVTYPNNNNLVTTVGSFLQPFGPGSYTPTVTPIGEVTSWQPTPELSALGLQVDPVVGTIYGVPAFLVNPAQTCNVKANYLGGQELVPVTIEIDTPPAPTDLIYYTTDPGTPVTSLTAQVGTPIDALNPQTSGGPVTGWGVSPALPAGLKLDPITGIISGTPLVVVANPTPYTITASNAGGSATNNLTLTVAPPPHTFTNLGDVVPNFGRAAATRLGNGKVLLTGGRTGDTALDQITLYDPVAGTFSPSATHLQTARDAHTATLLNDGTVFIFGGLTGNANPPTVTGTWEVYDPVSDSITHSGTRPTPRVGHTATVGNDADHSVFIVGGANWQTTGTQPNVQYAYGALDTTEVYDPVTQSFSTLASHLTSARWHHTATQFAGSPNWLVVAGGNAGTQPNTDPTPGFPDPDLNTSEYLDTSQGSSAAWSSQTQTMSQPRSSHVAFLMPAPDSNHGPQVLVAGGEGVFFPPHADEFIVNLNPLPISGFWNGLTTIDLSSQRYGLAGADLAGAEDSIKLLTGGYNSDTLDLSNRSYDGTFEYYDPYLLQESGPYPMPMARGDHATTVLPGDATALLTGGQGSNGAFADAWIFDPTKVNNATTHGWTPVSPATPRRHGTATTMDGPYSDQVLVVGGETDGSITSGGVPTGTATYQIFDGATNTWTQSPSSTSLQPMTGHGADTLGEGNGAVLVAGGRDGNGAASDNVQIYQPGSDWTAPHSATTNPTGPVLSAPRVNPTVTNVGPGLVLIVGGDDGSATPVASGAYDFYQDPANGVVDGVIAGGTIPLARTGHTATYDPYGGEMVLVGGEDPSQSMVYDNVSVGQFIAPKSGGEIVDWDPIGPFHLNHARCNHTATYYLSPTADPATSIPHILVVGGFDGSSATDSAELLTEDTDGNWSSTDLPPIPNHKRQLHSACLTIDGKVLVTGGVDEYNQVLTDAELFDPDTHTWTTVTPMVSPRSSHTSTLVDTRVLVFGGDPVQANPEFFQ